MRRYIIVKMQQFAILPKCVKDNLRYLSEEVDLRDDLELLIDLVEIAIGQKDELLWSGIAFLDVGDGLRLLLGVLLTLAQ